MQETFQCFNMGWQWGKQAVQYHVPSIPKQIPMFQKAGKISSYKMCTIWEGAGRDSWVSVCQ